MHSNTYLEPVVGYEIYSILGDFDGGITYSNSPEVSLFVNDPS